MRANEDLDLQQDEEQELDQQMMQLEDHSTASVEDEAEVAELPRAITNYQDVMTAMHLILEGKPVDLDKLPGIDESQREALEELILVVRGRSDRGNQLIYAEHRIEGLNHILAVLGPVMSVGVLPGLEGLQGWFGEVVDQLSDLRQRLDQIDAAQEEYMFEEGEALAAGEADQDDKPKPDDGLGEVTDKPRPSFLAGKPGDKAIEKPEVATTLTGKPEAPDRPALTTTLTGKPEAPDRPELATTLTGKPNEKPVELPERKTTL